MREWSLILMFAATCPYGYPGPCPQYPRSRKPRLDLAARHGCSTRGCPGSLRAGVARLCLTATGKDPGQARNRHRFFPRHTCGLSGNACGGSNALHGAVRNSFSPSRHGREDGHPRQRAAKAVSRRDMIAAASFPPTTLSSTRLVVDGRRCGHDEKWAINRGRFATSIDRSTRCRWS